MRAGSRCNSWWAAPVCVCVVPAGGWKRHGTKRRLGWKVLYLTTDADTGQIAASVLTSSDADDGSQVGPLLERVNGSVASLTRDGAYDRDDVYAAWVG